MVDKEEAEGCASLYTLVLFSLCVYMYVYLYMHTYECTYTYICIFIKLLNLLYINKINFEKTE